MSDKIKMKLNKIKALIREINDENEYKISNIKVGADFGLEVTGNNILIKED